MKSIKVAIIGAGNIAEEHIKSFLATKRVKLVGIYSRTFSKSEKLKFKYKISKAFKSIDEMYISSGAELVVVAVSIISVKKILKIVSKHNWYCLCEKPIGINYKETLEISKYFKNKNKFFVAFNRRHYDSTLLAQKILKKDNSKRLILINDQEDIIRAKKFHPNIVCKNFMYANSIHLVDYCQIFARGNPNKFINLTKIKNKNFSFFSKKIIFDSGDVVIFNSIWNRPAPWFVKLVTRDFFINLEPLEEISFRGDFKYKRNNILEKKYKKLKPGFFMQAQLVINSIKTGKIFVPNLDDGIKTTKLVKKIFNNFIC